MVVLFDSVNTWLYQASNSDPSVVHSVVSHFTDRATQAPSMGRYVLVGTSHISINQHMSVARQRLVD
jgi:hypothetical protein